MRIRLAKLLSWGIVSMLSAAASAAQGQSPSIIGPAGTWNGQWSSPSGYIYDARMQLESGSGGTIHGQIHWTLQKSPAAEEQAKLGMTGVELVRGSYDPASRVLTFDGYDKTDSNSILGLDKYRLLLADNANVLGGITWNHGSWRGVFNLTRAGTESSSEGATLKNVAVAFFAKPSGRSRAFRSGQPWR